MTGCSLSSLHLLKLRVRCCPLASGDRLAGWTVRSDWAVWDFVRSFFDCRISRFFSYAWIDVRSGAFAADRYSEILSGYQSGRVVEQFFYVTSKLIFILRGVDEQKIWKIRCGIHVMSVKSVTLAEGQWSRSHDLDAEKLRDIKMFWPRPLIWRDDYKLYVNWGLYSRLNSIILRWNYEKKKKFCLHLTAKGPWIFSFQTD